MKSTSRLLVSVLAAVVLAAACGSNAEETTTSTTAAPTTAAPTTQTVAPTTSTTAAPTTEPVPEKVTSRIEESFVGAVANPYSDPPIVDGEVRVYFNNGTSGNMVAIYHGPGLSEPDGLCPGNSFNDGSFRFVSNAPTSEGACEGFTTDVGSVRVCTANVWLYQTMIPNDSVGDLYGSVEILENDAYKGLTAVATNKTGTPAIDFSATDYEIPAMFTSDGSTEITCGKALT